MKKLEIGDLKRGKSYLLPLEWYDDNLPNSFQKRFEEDFVVVTPIDCVEDSGVILDDCDDLLVVYSTIPTSSERDMYPYFFAENAKIFNYLQPDEGYVEITELGLNVLKENYEYKRKNKPV